MHRPAVLLFLRTARKRAYVLVHSESVQAVSLSREAMLRRLKAASLVSALLLRCSTMGSLHTTIARTGMVALPLVTGHWPDCKGTAQRSVIDVGAPVLRLAYKAVNSGQGRWDVTTAGVITRQGVLHKSTTSAEVSCPRAEERRYRDRGIALLDAGTRTLGSLAAAKGSW